MKSEIKIPTKASTLIDKDTKFTGNFEADGNIVIHGRIDGNIVCHNDVYVGKNSVINGNITSKNLYVFGVIQGNVTTDGLVYLDCNAKLFGDATSKSFTAVKGCIYKGSLQTSEDIKEDETIREIQKEDEVLTKEESIIENL